MLVIMKSSRNCSECVGIQLTEFLILFSVVPVPLAVVMSAAKRKAGYKKPKIPRGISYIT